MLWDNLVHTVGTLSGGGVVKIFDVKILFLAFCICNSIPKRIMENIITDS